MNISDHINKKMVGILFFILLLLIGLIWYFFLRQPKTPAGALTIINSSPLEGTLGRDLLATLSRMKVTTLDASIWSDPVFTSLHDFGVEIATQPVGRRNPFAAFGSTTPDGKGASAGAKNTGKPPAALKTKSAATVEAPQDTSGGFDSF